MNTKIVKKLVDMTVVEGRVDETIRGYVLSKLSKTCLRDYLYFLNLKLQQNEVHINLPGIPDEAGKRKFQEIFKGKKVIFGIDRSIGAGIRIEHNDNVINLNMRSFIGKAVNNLKENL